MRGYFDRNLSADINNSLKNNPVTAILGPRQCGKSTHAKLLLEKLDKSVYLDLESPSDLRKLDDPETFFEINRGCLVCLDEIQRKPDIFPVLRSIVDKTGENVEGCERLKNKFCLSGCTAKQIFTNHCITG
jgi:predicted AAA+ superfamily ATPase